MTTALNICRTALAHLGDVAEITSISPPDGSVQAALCAAFYSQSVAEVMERHTWGFATKRAALVLSAESPPSSWIYAYDAPLGVAPTLSNQELTPDLSGWSLSHGGSGSDPAYSSGQALMIMIGGPSAGNNFSRMTQAITGLTVGGTYTVSYSITRVIGSGACDFRVMVGTSANAADVYSHTATAISGVPQTGTNSFQFTATSTAHYITAGLFDSLLSPANTQAFLLDYVRVPAITENIANYLAVLDPQAMDDTSSPFPTQPSYPMMFSPGRYAYTPQPFAVEASVTTGLPLIYSNVPNAVLRYTIANPPEGQFSPLCVSAIAWRLASYLAGPIIKGDAGAQASQRCYQAYQTVLQEAIESDANQRRIDARPSVSWIRNR